MKKLQLFALLSMLSFAMACSDDDDDTVAVSYSKDVQPILSTNCAACHSPNGAASGTGLLLNNYDNTKAATAITRNGQNSIISSIKHLANFSPMPQSPNPKLSDATIKKIEDWINAGAPNN